MSQQTLLPAERPAVAVVERSQEPTALEMIAEAARDPNVSVDKLRELFALKKDVDAYEAKLAFNRAMKAAQDEMRPVVRDAENQHTKSKYARLETIDAAIRPIYTRHGFALTFNSPSLDGEYVSLTGTALHEAGHSEPFSLKGPLDCTGAQGKANKTGIQGLGSTISYLRRYLTLMIFNVTLKGEDNDGQPGWITERQSDTIEDLIAQCGTANEPADVVRAGFLRYMGAKLVSEIHARDFQKAVTALESKRRKVGN